MLRYFSKSPSRQVGATIFDGQNGSSNYSDISHTIEFLLNGKLITIKEGEKFDPTDSLVTYLRSEKVNHKGTKRGCEEGGCGSCTVVMSSYDPVAKRIKHRPINSCLMPIANVHHTSITTIENIQNSLTNSINSSSKSSNLIYLGDEKAEKLKQIQESIKRHHATQCGFCTPGFIMSALALVLEKPNPSKEDLAYHFDGNLCRCTGYRAILEALREFTVDSKPNDSIISEQRSIKNDNNNNNNNSNNSNSNSVNINDTYLDKFANIKDNKTTIINYKDNHFFALPKNLDSLLSLKRDNPNAKLIVGNTELFASTSERHDYISTHLVDELKYIKVENNTIKIGASTPIDVIYEFCEKNETDRVLRAMKKKISVFASNQTRSVASLTGNIAMHGSSTDFTNFLPGVNATVEIIDSVTGQIRKENLDNEFFTGRFKTSLKDTDVIKEISFPLTENNNDHCFTYKTAIRREIAGCILSATIRASISESDNKIEKIRIAFSRLALKASRALKAEQFLVGKEFTMENIEEAIKLIDEEFPIDETAKSTDFENLCEYRRDLSHNFMIKFYHETEKERGRKYDDSIASEIEIKPPEVSVSCQCKKDKDNHNHNGNDNDKLTTIPISRTQTVGKSVTHLAAPYMIKGKAEFTDDIPLNERAKHAAFVTSTISHGIIKEIKLPTENVTLITAKDLPKGTNRVAELEEPLLADEKVTFYGQPIAIVVADTEREAWEIASKVKVEYQTVLPAIVSIEEAIENGKVFKGPSMKTLKAMSDRAKSNNNDDDIEVYFNQNQYNVVEGEVKMGGQHHFYIEPNAAVADHTSDGQFLIQPTCRNLDIVREQAAKFLEVNQTNVEVNVKRIGGAFCGKSARSTYVSSAAAIATAKLDCPVKMRLQRCIDTHLMSGDHNFLCRYKVAFTEKGRIIALKMKFFVDAGFSYKNTSSLLEKAILHCDSVYSIPNIEVESFFCQTNKISAAHFRGFGCQNGQISIEGVFERIARYLNFKDAEEVKRINFYRKPNTSSASINSSTSNDVSSDDLLANTPITPYGVSLVDDLNISECWDFVKNVSNYENLRKSCNAFNVINKSKKRGLAITPVKFGVGQPTAKRRKGSALIHLLKDGTIYISHCGVEVGQGLHTKMSQLVSNYFDIPIENVRIDKTNSCINSEAASTGAGFTNDLAGFAILDACRKLEKRISRFYYIDENQVNDGDNDITFTGKRRKIGDNEKRRSFADVVKLAYDNKMDLTAHGYYISEQEGFDFKAKKGRPYQYYEYGAAVSMVEIDALTGQNHILESHIVFDAGQSLNPGIDIGQVEGGFMQGVGWLTTEKISVIQNPKTNKSQNSTNSNAVVGKPQNDTMYKYKIPALSALPTKFSVHLLPDSHNKIGIMSARGVGEPPGMLANSVGFAIIDAIDAARKEKKKDKLENYEFPLTVERIRYYITQP